MTPISSTLIPKDFMWIAAKGANTPKPVLQVHYNKQHLRNRMDKVHQHLHDITSKYSSLEKTIRLRSLIGINLVCFKSWISNANPFFLSVFSSIAFGVTDCSMVWIPGIPFSALSSSMSCELIKGTKQNQIQAPYNTNKKGKIQTNVGDDPSLIESRLQDEQVNIWAKLMPSWPLMQKHGHWESFCSVANTDSYRSMVESGKKKAPFSPLATWGS